MRKFFLLSTAIWFLVTAASATTTSSPQIGAPAPELHFTQLLQAPPGARVDWTALRGKVVVLEFWATWCGPCVANIPHLNELASVLDPSKFQFISIDDEDLNVVKNFLSKRKMAGWLGLDATGTTFKRYGAEARPLTVIVDPRGRIAARTQPQFVNAKDLRALAAGKKVSFKTFEGPISTGSMTIPIAKSGTDPVFLLEITKVPIGTKGGGVSAKDNFLLFGMKPISLLAFAFDASADRFIVNTSLPKDLYNLHAEFAGASDLATRPLLQTAVTASLHVRVERKNVIKKVYALRTTPQSRSLLVPSVPNAGKMQGYWNGKVHIVGGSMDELASQLEGALHEPVLNETGIAGEYDAELPIPSGNVVAAQDAVAKVMGLELVEENRPVAMLEIDALPSGKTGAGH